jgi:hypothetical protein
MKKMIKWYGIVKKLNLINEPETEEAAETAPEDAGTEA